MRVVKANEMQEMDRKTIHELGIPGIVLMENAGRGASRAFLEHFLPPPEAKVLIVCGRGNNGGDGYVVARYLAGAGLRPTVLILSSMEKISGDAAINLKIIRSMGIEIFEIQDESKWNEQKTRLAHSHYIVDAILGTGLNSPVRGFYGKVIDQINESGKALMAIDIPSGLNADNGRVMGKAIRANLTVTFGFPKVGQVVYPGVELVGRLVRIDISIPESVANQVPGNMQMTEPEDFAHLLEDPKQDVHKGNRGHLLILAGSTGKTGAATMAAIGAIRAGSGLVTVGIPASLNHIMEEKLTEAMTVPLPETNEGTLSKKAKNKILELLEGKTALAIGPGISSNPETVELICTIISETSIPIIVDADGLNALASNMDILSECKSPVVLTPHPGEMSRLTGLSTSEIQSDRVKTALDFVSVYPCTLVLKGARSIIAQANGRLFINPTGNPALASGGSGDVLTGLIGGFLARGWTPQIAAVAGTYIHGLAADYLAEDMGTVGILAGELLHVVPEIMRSLSRGEWPLAEPAPHSDFYQPL